MKDTDHAFNVIIPKSLFTRWKDEAAYQHMSSGAMLRRQMATYLSMAETGTPLCANGQRCFVPQMHAQHQPRQPEPVAPPAEGRLPS